MFTAVKTSNAAASFPFPKINLLLSWIRHSLLLRLRINSEMSLSGTCQDLMDKERDHRKACLPPQDNTEPNNANTHPGPGNIRTHDRREYAP